MAILGPLPGFLIYSFPPSGAFLYGGPSMIPLGLLWYFPAAIAMFGPFCFVAGFAGAFVIRLTQESRHAWLPGLAIFALPPMDDEFRAPMNGGEPRPGSRRASGPGLSARPQTSAGTRPCLRPEAFSRPILRSAAFITG